MEKIEGAKLIGRIWHYYKRVPKRLVDAYGLPEFKRGSMQTKDPDKARVLARAMLGELDELAEKLDSVPERVKVFGDLSAKEQDQLERDIAQNVGALPHDQRQLLQKAGSVMKARSDMEAHEVSAAFMTGAIGAEYRVKDDIGEEYDPDEREVEEAADESFLALQQRKGKALRSALNAADVIEPTADADSSLRVVLGEFCDAKGYVHTDKIKNKTRGQYEYAVRRFVEYHGDLSLADLSRKHLSDFAADFLKLPVSPRKDIRPLAFWDAVKAADRENLPRASVRTRNQNLTLLKSLMAYAAKEGDNERADPWAGYTPTVAKGKYSAARKKKKHVFIRDEVKRIVGYTSKTRNSDTVDFWGPLWGAFHGLRLEEVSQMRIGDVTNEEGFLCLSVTDEGELQKVKNENTFRTIPIHLGLVDRGFEDFVARRRQAGGDMLFMEAERWGGKLHEIAHDGQGRFGTMYGTRFTRELGKLNIQGYKAGYHSFRHAWTDLARNAGIDPEQRRALAGRESDEDSFGPRVDRVENNYGHGFAISVLADSLNKLRPLG